MGILALATDERVVEETCTKDTFHAQKFAAPAERAKQAHDLLTFLVKSVGGYVTNLRHEPVPLGAFERQVVQRLDGAHDRTALLKVLGDLVQQNELTVQFEGEAVKDPKRLESMLGEALEQQLGRLAKQSLVVE